MKWLSCLVLIVFCFSCKTKTNTPIVNIALIDTGKSLKITGLNYAVMQDVSRDNSNSWENLLPVYRMPADTDMKNYQPVQPGRYVVKDSALVFTPDTPFIKHQLYFMRQYHYNETGDIWSFIKGNRRPGQIAYTDLIFKQ